jgi:hypothetical protein
MDLLHSLYLNIECAYSIVITVVDVVILLTSKTAATVF